MGPWPCWPEKAHPTARGAMLALGSNSKPSASAREVLFCIYTEHVFISPEIRKPLTLKAKGSVTTLYLQMRKLTH